MLKILITVILTLVAMVPTYGQNEECILDAVNDGDIIKVQGRLLTADFRLMPATCPQNMEHSIWVKWGDDHSLGESKLPVNRDRVFLEFERMRKEEMQEGCYPRCPKYQVNAVELEGKFEILPYPKDKDISPGFAEIDGKVIRYITRYRLIATSILSFEVEEYESIDPPLEKEVNGVKGFIDIVPTGKIIRIDSRTEIEQEAN